MIRLRAMPMIVILVILSLTSHRTFHAQEVEELNSLSDEFNDESSIKSWKRIYQTEQWPADHLEAYSINKHTPGAMHLMPYTSCWYKDYRSTLIYKEVTGDFVITMKLQVTNRTQNAAPGSQFSLAGIMIRTPSDRTSRNWRPGGENYLFLSMGTANQPGRFQLEDKTTVNSDSKLNIHNIPIGKGELRIVRQGAAFIALAKIQGQNWRVIQRFNRPDMPKTLQVGATCYTDWPNNEPLGARRHNIIQNKGGNPDLIADIDYIRFQALPDDLPENIANQNPQNILKLLSFESQPSDDIAGIPNRFHGLKLSDEQKDKIREIQVRTQKQIEELKKHEERAMEQVLTPEQRRTLSN